MEKLDLTKEDVISYLNQIDVVTLCEIIISHPKSYIADILKRGRIIYTNRQNIDAGLDLKKGVKLFTHNGKFKCLYNGELIWERRVKDVIKEYKQDYREVGIKAVYKNMYPMNIDDDYKILPMDNVKLFLVERGDGHGYDEYDSILVACQTPEQAKAVMSQHPYNEYVDLDKLTICKIADGYCKTIYVPHVPIASFNA